MTRHVTWLIDRHRALMARILTHAYSHRFVSSGFDFLLIVALDIIHLLAPARHPFTGGSVGPQTNSDTSHQQLCLTVHTRYPRLTHTQGPKENSRSYFC